MFDLMLWSRLDDMERQQRLTNTILVTQSIRQQQKLQEMQKQQEQQQSAAKSPTYPNQWTEE